MGKIFPYGSYHNAFYPNSTHFFNLQFDTIPMKEKSPSVYLASPVFLEIASNAKVSENLKQKIKELYSELKNHAHLIVSPTRFPTSKEIRQIVQTKEINFIGCHLSHPITEEITQTPSLLGICTSTAGFNHIHQDPSLLITHTPSVLDKTVADFTIALILANLRNLFALHTFLWGGQWTKDQKWDLDENLNNTLDNLTVGIIGLGEIGKEVVRRLAPWGINILYHDLKQNRDFDSNVENLSYCDKLEDLLRKSDVISIHVPLNKNTTHLLDKTKLRLLKNNALLINTARGPIIHFEDLLDLLENKEISINLGFDVFEEEPIPKDVLKRFHHIKEMNPALRFLFIPHNASSDADTRAKMAIMLLEDLITLVKSTNLDDIHSLRLIPPLRSLSASGAPQKKNKQIEDFRIYSWWKQKKH